jgi:hypothetical protein
MRVFGSQESRTMQNAGIIAEGVVGYIPTSPLTSGNEALLFVMTEQL